MNSQPKLYSEKEEKWNVLTHAFGFLMSIILFVLLILKAFPYVSISTSLSYIVFGLCVTLLYAASTLYHNEKNTLKRQRLQVLDHIAIYLLIAGTYTPFLVISLSKESGNLYLGLIWGIAFLGIVFKIFFTGKYIIISTLSYVLMGWLVIFVFPDLQKNISEQSQNMLFLGGLFYTLGAILYSIKKIPYNHAIFHVFVLLGSFSHAYAILYL